MTTPTVYTVRYANDAAGPSLAGETPMSTTYSLVELPAVLLASLQAASKEASTSSSSASSSYIPSDLVIKGQPSDDAVLCTRDSTYNLRAVKNSNSLLLCKPTGTSTSKEKGKEKATGLEIESTLHQTLELELVVPKLDRIGELLRGSEWSPDIAEEERAAKKVRHAIHQKVGPF